MVGAAETLAARRAAAGPLTAEGQQVAARRATKGARPSRQRPTTEAPASSTRSSSTRPTSSGDEGGGFLAGVRDGARQGRRLPARAVAGVTASDLSGFTLGLLAWAWVALPFLQGGPEKVRAVWAAKFLNRAPDGSELP